MKKTLALILLLALLLGACGEKQTARERVGEALGLDLSWAELMSENDTHGGFHGDGITIIQLRVGDISGFLEGKEGWHELPLDPEHPVYGYIIGSFPEDCDTGKWYFYDRHSKASDPYDSSQLNKRHSMNFTAAVYNSESGVLNYYEFDT